MIHFSFLAPTSQYPESSPVQGLKFILRTMVTLNHYPFRVLLWLLLFGCMPIQGDPFKFSCAFFSIPWIFTVSGFEIHFEDSSNPESLPIQGVTLIFAVRMFAHSGWAISGVVCLLLNTLNLHHFRVWNSFWGLVTLNHYLFRVILWLFLFECLPIQGDPFQVLSCAFFSIPWIFPISGFEIHFED